MFDITRTPMIQPEANGEGRALGGKTNSADGATSVALPVATEIDGYWRGAWPLWVVRPLVGAYRKVPKYFLEHTNLEVLFPLMMTGVFCGLRFFSSHLLTSELCGFPASKNGGEETFEEWSQRMATTERASSCVVAVLQSLLIAPGVVVNFLTQGYRPVMSLHESVSGLWYPDMICKIFSISAAYLVYDIMMTMKTSVFDGQCFVSTNAVVYVFHHVLSLFVLVSSAVLRCAHHTVLIAILLMEVISNPLRNAATTLEIAVGLHPYNLALKRAHAILNYSDAIVYIAIRAVLVPATTLHASFTLLSKSGRQRMPLWIGSIWVVIFWAVIFGSIPWIQRCFAVLAPSLGSAQDEF